MYFLNVNQCKKILLALYFYVSMFCTVKILLSGLENLHQFTLKSWYMYALMILCRWMQY
jgi:hypothetical protein